MTAAATETAQYLANKRLRRAFRARFVLGYGLSYAIDTVLLGLLAALGTVPAWIPIAYGGAGLCICGAFYGLLATGASERFRDTYLAAAQVIASGAVMVVFIGLAPQIGAFFLSILFLVAGFGSLRLTRRAALGCFAAIMAGTGTVVYFTPGITWLPHSTSAEIAVVWIGFLTILARLTGLGMVGNEIRLTLLKRNRQLKESHRALAARSEELTAARAAADAASRVKSQFLASMSHEIRTPMNAVIGFAELLLASELSAQQRERAAGILGAGQGLLRVINDILDVSRIEAGRMELIDSYFEPRRLLESVRELLTPLAGMKGFAVALEICPGTPAVLVGDEGRLRQILVNLGTNAVKFTERGEVRMAMEARSAAPGTVRLLLRVSDTGIGMSEDQIGKLFAPFVQLDAGRARQHGGTGLGLHIAREFARLMGGSLEVRSTPGQGSSFEVQVPMRVTPVLAAQPAAQAQAPAAPVAKAGAILTLLLVEDNEINQEVARAMLEAAGHRVELACEGAEALRLNAQQRFDCILMDCQMPGMDGFEATQRIRAREAERGAARVPIVALTANAMRGDRERCLAAGMDDFLAKPFDTVSLLAVVTRNAGQAAAEPGSAGIAASFDATALDDLLGVERGNPGFLAQLAERFFEDSGALIASVAGASEAFPEDAQRAAHSLKSISARLGAYALAALAAQAEAAARDGRLDAARRLAGPMQEELARAAGLMRQHPALIRTAAHD